MVVLPLGFDFDIMPLLIMLAIARNQAVRNAVLRAQGPIVFTLALWVYAVKIRRGWERAAKEAFLYHSEPRAVAYLLSLRRGEQKT